MVVMAYYPLGETRVQREAEALLAQGYQVDVICPQDINEPLAASHRGVQVYRLPIRLSKGSLLRQFLNYLHFFVRAAVKLTQLHQRQAYGGVQVHNLPDFLVFCTLALKLQGVPIILDLHDLMPEFYVSRFGRSPKSALLRGLVCRQERWACRFADHVVTVSEHWRQTLIKRGVPAHKCTVVMNVADERIFHPSKARSTPSLKDGSFRLIYHGTIVKRYGLDLAVQALHQVRHEIPHIHLTILGVGDQVTALDQMILELGLNNQVSIYGERPVEDLPEIIQTADLGIVPYRDDVFTDSLLPTKLMEYAAMGLPAIAARTTAMQAYFQDTMVEFFEPNNVHDLARCIRLLYSSPERLAALARGCESFNQQYNWSKTGAVYVALVDRLRTG
jgi:glycosyltransferase involved in cell wall biosynthesis